MVYGCTSILFLYINMTCHPFCDRPVFGASFLNAICMLCCMSPSPLSFDLALRSTFTEKTQWFCNKFASHRSGNDQFLIPCCFDLIDFLSVGQQLVPKPLRSGASDMRQPVYISTTLGCTLAGTQFNCCSFRWFPLRLSVR